MTKKRYHGVGVPWNSRNTRKRRGWGYSEWEEYRARYEATFGKKPEPETGDPKFRKGTI